jgi:hypothetical protein
MPPTKVWPTQHPLQFDSALSPLLDALHADVKQYEEVLNRVSELQTRYSLPEAIWPDNASQERYEGAAAAFDTVLAHVLAVEEHGDRGYVLLPRERFAEVGIPCGRSALVCQGV